jgi:two-component system phosphate regulon response regulator PhoB
MWGMAEILVVDDEPGMRDLLTAALKRAGYACREASDVDGARQSILDAPPDLILLDWMLPGRSGIDFVHDLRQLESTRATPIVLLTARSEERDRIYGFDVGADDYVTKPFSMGELLGRIKAVLRRTAPAKSTEAVEVNGLRVDPQNHRVTAGDRTLECSPTEFRLLYFLMTHPDRVYSRDQIIDGVWGRNSFVGERTVDVHVRLLRKALSASGHQDMVQTVRGAGYRLSLAS